MSSAPYIYGLASSRDGQIRYIGQTRDDVEERVRQHVKTAFGGERTPVYEWMTTEIAAGFEIFPTILKAQANWNVDERAFIAHYRALGFPL